MDSGAGSSCARRWLTTFRSEILGMDSTWRRSRASIPKWRSFTEGVGVLGRPSLFQVFCQSSAGRRAIDRKARIVLPEKPLVAGIQPDLLLPDSREEPRCLQIVRFNRGVLTHGPATPIREPGAVSERTGRRAVLSPVEVTTRVACVPTPEQRTRRPVGNRFCV